MSYITPLSSRFRDPFGRRGRKPWRARGSRWLQGNNIFQIQQGRWTHIWTPRDCDSVYKTFINSRQTKFHHRGRKEGTESYPEPRSYICNWQLLKRENQFLQWSDNRYISHILGQDPYPGVVSQHKLNSMVCVVCFLKREKKHEVGCTGGEDLGRVGEWKKNMIKIYCVKTSKH